MRAVGRGELSGADEVVSALAKTEVYTKDKEKMVQAMSSCYISTAGPGRENYCRLPLGKDIPLSTPQELIQLGQSVSWPRIILRKAG